tara:strand:+ start:27560 stop:28840 length:1281 start_codon:yes stop_codon:yes gene_type:complete
MCILMFSFSVLFPVCVDADDRKIEKAVKKYTTSTIELRHQIHQYPELGNREFKTAELVANHLKSLGIEVQTGVAHTGVIGILKGDKPGPVVAVRADMDALPVTEDTDLPFKSTVRTTYLGNDVGVMHACGHDIHTSVQLGVASVLSSIRKEIHGTVKFIFQPAEEGPPPGEEGGADLMVRENTMENPRPVAVFGLHALASMEAGNIGYTSGPAFAAVDHFIAKVKGKQAHGARPEESIDPVVMASEVVTAFQTIRSRSLNPREPSVVTVGIIRGGQRFNIIPSEVHLEGTVRTYSEEARDGVENRMNQILKGITSAYGGSYELDYDRGTPATINDPKLTAQVVPSLQRAIGRENVMEVPPTMGGEDFSFFANVVPGFYYRLGMVKPGTVSGGHHTPTFRADDSCIPIGMKAMSTLIIDFMKSGGLQ